MALEKLQREYPPGSRGVGALVLREYRAIQEARSHGWTWAEIALEMGQSSHGAHRALANAFARITRRIDAGHLVPPKAPVAARAPQGSAPPAPPTQATQVANAKLFNSLPSIGGRK